MNKPTVSIIMSTYNDAAYIKEAIDSVLTQSYTDWEFIIINDASTDNSDAIIKDYVKNDNRFKYLLNKKNKKQAVNLNTCISLAKGQYLAVLDSDDVWIDIHKLKKQVNFLNKHPKYGFVGSWAYLTDKNNNRISLLQFPETDSAIRKYMLIENCFMHDTVLMRKTSVDRIGGYNTKLRSTHDYCLWLKLGLTGKMYIMKDYMLNYRQNPKGSTLSKYNQQLEETSKIIKEFKNNYPDYSKAIFLWRLRKYIPKNNHKILVLKKIIRKYIFKTN